jgi:hypothetical protein
MLANTTNIFFLPLKYSPIPTLSNNPHLKNLINLLNVDSASNQTTWLIYVGAAAHMAPSLHIFDYNMKEVLM